jgi:serine/threonine protein kinase/WD40 repeat protein
LSEFDSVTERLSELAHEFVERLRRGEAPTVEQLAAEHPELADEVRELIPTMLLMEQLDPAANFGDTQRTTSADEPQFPWQLGEYRILRRIGQGGMGTVYEAVQESLGRHVALKILSRSDTKNATLHERFKREAQAAAQLHHTNIVPVFGVGEAAGTIYYAMQLIHGQSLDRVLANAACGQPGAALTMLGPADADYYRAVARLGAQAAEALAYAHAEGVLHRDIKPANMLLDAHGTVWVTDFGLAQIEGLSDLTVADEVIGTLRYVPPERFEGRTDARGDVYSLGLTLHELLTRQPAFGSVTRAELVRRILHESPVALRSIDRRFPRDLETIIAKAIAREPARRYQTAADMAEDLRRFCSDQPILARRLSIAERSRRWCRKNPMVALVSSLAVLMLLAVAIVSTIAYLRESDLRESLQDSLQRVQKAEVESRKQLVGSYVASAKAARLTRQQGQRLDSLAAIHKAVELLPELELQPIELQQRRDELRDLAISCLTLPDIRDLGDLPAGFAPDVFYLNRFAHRDATGTLIVSQWPGGSELARLPDVSQHTWFEFTPIRDEMILVDQDVHTLHRWQLQDAAPKLIAQLREHESKGWNIEFSRDASRVMLLHQMGSQGLVEVLDWPSGKHCVSFETPFQDDLFHRAQLSPDGRMVAVIEGEYRSAESRLVRVTEVDTGLEQTTLEHAASVDSIAWHPDSQSLAVGLTDSNDVVLWNVPHQKQVGILTDQRGGGPLLYINSAGELLASSSSWVKSVDLWHPYSHKLLLHMPSHLIFASSSNDGRLLGKSSAVGEGWHYAVAEPSPVVRTLLRNPIHGPVEAWRDVSVHPGGRLLAVGSDNGVSLFDLETGQDVGYLPVGYTLHPWFIPATGDLLTYSEQGLLRWPVSFIDVDPSLATIGPSEKLPCEARYGTEVSSDHTGRVIAAAAGKWAVILHDFGQRVIVLDSLNDCRTIAVSPDGRWVVTACHKNGPLDIWDADSGTQIRHLNDDHEERDVCFSPDSDYLAFIRFSQRLMYTETWQERALPDAPGIGFVCFSPDGRLAIDLHPAGATLRDFRSGRKIATLALPDLPMAWFAKFTPDGQRVVLSANDQHATYVWDLRRLSSELAAIDLGWDAPSLLPAVTSPTLSRPVSSIQVRVIQ